ncbi:MAG: hypothetical protein Q4C73_01390 [Eubacteriales bacterium]|nr:hypothetical protein [Eubacteriales bacterium]
MLKKKGVCREENLWQAVRKHGLFLFVPKSSLMYFEKRTRGKAGGEAEKQEKKPIICAVSPMKIKTYMEKVENKSDDLRYK